jgi:predicted Zn-dependent protease
MTRLSALLFIAALLSGCGQGHSELSLVSRGTAEALGQRDYAATLDQARANSALDANPAQVALVDGIAARLVDEAKRRHPIGRDWHWEIHVLGSDAVNAFCVPGGKMMVLSGLLEASAMDPDKIAMVVGHEIAHALLEHSRANLSRDWVLQSGMWIVSKSLKMGVARSQSALAGLNTVLLPMHRDLEREADVLGLELMARAGFNPEQGLLFWQDAMARNGQAAAGEQNLEAFLSTHPTDQERLQRLATLAKQWHRPEAKP